MPNFRSYLYLSDICTLFKLSQSVQELTNSIQRTSQSYVCPCIKVFDQYVFFLLSVEIQADQSHFQEAGASDKPTKEKKYTDWKKDQTVNIIVGVKWSRG